MKTEIYFKEEAMKKILDGVHKLSSAVGSTLGPGGRNVIYEQYGWRMEFLLRKNVFSGTIELSVKSGISFSGIPIF